MEKLMNILITEMIIGAVALAGIITFSRINNLLWTPAIGLLSATLYVIYMFIANLAKATESSKKYAFIAIFIAAMLQMIPEYIFL